MPDIEKDHRTGWPYKHLATALIISLLSNTTLMPFPYGDDRRLAQGLLYLVLGAFITLRLFVAAALNQKDKGWKFYLILISSSPVWFPIGIQIVCIIKGL